MLEPSAVELNWTSDGDVWEHIDSAVPSQSLTQVLDEQRQKLSTIDSNRPGKERYLLARQAGCLAAVSKGVKDRRLTPDQIYFPSSEIARLNGKIRISSIKATLPVPSGLYVRSVTFLHMGNSEWCARLEVKRMEEKAA